MSKKIRHTEFPKGTKLVVLVCLFVLLTFFSNRLYSVYSMRIWNSDNVFIVFNSDTWSIEIYNPKKEEIHTYVLPKDAYVDVAEGYGNYKLKDIYELARVEGKGEKLIKDSVSNTFGIPFDATYKTLREWDKLLLWYAQTTYRTKEITMLDDAPIFISETRIDGEKIIKVNPEKVDSYLASQMWDKIITDENLTIGIFNASDQANIAYSLSRKLEKIGVHITDTDNWTEPFTGQCEIRTIGEIRDSYTVKRIRHLFNCLISEEKPLSRFDVMIITSRIL